MSAELSKCPCCGAPCRTEVLMRGGEHGWGTTDEERTVYHYAPPTTAPAPAPYNGPYSADAQAAQAIHRRRR